MANKAFPIEQPVLDFMCEEFRCSRQDFRQMELDPGMKLRLEKFIKGLKVTYEMPNSDGKVQKRIYKVAGLGGNPIQETYVNETHNSTYIINFSALKNNRITRTFAIFNSLSSFIIVMLFVKLSFRGI